MKNKKAFTPLEKTANFNRWSTNFKTDGGSMPPSAQTVGRRNSLTGFTLIELMVTLLIFTIILTAIYSSFTISNNFYQIDMGLLNVQQQARQAMDWLVKELRESSSSSVSISYTSPSLENITFNTPSKTGIQYYVASGQLIREHPVGTTRVIANNITALDYTLGSSTLKIALTTSTTALKRPISIQLVEKISLRN